MDLHAQVTSVFLDGGTNVDKLPDSDPKKAKGQAMGDFFTQGVGYLKTDFPNDTIRKLMSLVWDIVGSKITPIAMGPDVQSVSIAVFGNPVLPQAAVFLPHNWLDELKRDPVLQMGALVFVGSQIVDFYNRRLMDQAEQSIKRARAHEAEFLLTSKRHVPHLVFNDYQKKVLEDFPEGVSTLAVLDLLYTSKEFVPPA
jgi:hypothetical protein